MKCCAKKWKTNNYTGTDKDGKKFWTTHEHLEMGKDFACGEDPREFGKNILPLAHLVVIH